MVFGRFFSTEELEEEELEEELEEEGLSSMRKGVIDSVICVPVCSKYLNNIKEMKAISTNITKNVL
jgi:hypothetical protein